MSTVLNVALATYNTIQQGVRQWRAIVYVCVFLHDASITWTGNPMVSASVPGY